MNSAEPSLPELVSALWQELAEASRRPGHGWRLPILSTLHDEQPDSRILVLREVDPATKTFCCHTDNRSDKFPQLQNSSQVSWLFYDPVLQTQLRISGKVSLHQNDEIADRLWSESDPASLKLYLGTNIPGTISGHPESNLPDAYIKRAPSRQECESGRPYFCVIQTEVLTLDWMQLRPEGNLRAQFDWSSGELMANWLIP